MEKLNESTFILDNGFVRGYLLEGEKEALLLDTCMDIPDVYGKCKEVTEKPVSLYMSHGDMDHCGGNASFKEVHLHPAELVNYKHIEGQTYKFLRDGEIIDLGDREIEVIYTPGHTPGSVCLLDKKYRLLFTGDSVQTHNNIFMHGQMRNLYSYIDSLKKIYARKEEFDFCVSCHGDILVDKEVIKTLYEGAEKILKDEVPYESLDFHGKRIRRYDLGIVYIDTDEKERPAQ